MFKIIRSLMISTLIVLAGCGNQEKDPDAPKIVMTSPDNPPFEYIDTSSGSEKIVGFDIAVIHAIAEHLNWQIEIVPADFPSLIPALQSGRADLVIATMVPTPEREKSVDFSIPYYNAAPAFLIRAGSSIQSVSDLKNRQLGVQMGSTHEQAAKTLQQHNPEMQLVSLPRIGDLVQELKTGRIDAVLLEGPVVDSIIKNNPDLEKVESNDIQTESPAIAFPKGSPYVKEVNAAIRELQKNNVIEGMAKLWFTQTN